MVPQGTLLVRIRDSSGAKECFGTPHAATTLPHGGVECRTQGSHDTERSRRQSLDRLVTTHCTADSMGTVAYFVVNPHAGPATWESSPGKAINGGSRCEGRAQGHSRGFARASQVVVN